MIQERLNIIKSILSGFHPEYTDVNGTPQIIANTNNVIEICKILKENEETRFEMLIDAVSIDNFVKENRYEIVYNLYSIKFKYRLFVKVRLDSKEPKMPSLTAVWESANWYEREAYDMMGIIFTGHPDLRRIYMPEEFEYYPLRKDFPLMGIPGSLHLPKK
ncbi:MAG: NADH-quinone oxidoreductase subunit C [Ignavibacteria bacterium]|nr:NADH-quinone oxidoreductase subunit C [Ignavibacteria bacterium]